MWHDFYGSLLKLSKVIKSLTIFYFCDLLLSSWKMRWQKITCFISYKLNDKQTTCHIVVSCQNIFYTLFLFCSFSAHTMLKFKLDTRKKNFRIMFGPKIYANSIYETFFFCPVIPAPIMTSSNAVILWHFFFVVH